MATGDETQQSQREDGNEREEERRRRHTGKLSSTASVRGKTISSYCTTGHTATLLRREEERERARRCPRAERAGQYGHLDTYSLGTYYSFIICTFNIGSYV
jgi:hypothetical protein